MLEHTQKKFIKTKLKTEQICYSSQQLENKYQYQVDDSFLSSDKLEYRELKYISCVFNKIFSHITQRKKQIDGIYNVTYNISNWLHEPTKIDIESSQGNIYTSSLSGVNIILKTSKKFYKYEDMLREYFIGICAINNLRQVIPTFVYTLGAFIYNKEEQEQNSISSKNNLYILYENVQGKNLSISLTKGYITFETWLISFVQILLSLELSQKEIQFTHYDLHGNNIILSPNSEGIDQKSYTIQLVYEVYTVNKPPIIPVIIDFGHSSCKIDEKTIGSYVFSKHGMHNYMIQGHDMYKLLVYSISYASNNIELQDKIKQILLFYGYDNDPYNILFTDNGLEEAMGNYCSLVSESYAATYTPIMMVKWLLNKKEYASILSSYISVKKRVQYSPPNINKNILCKAQSHCHYQDINSQSYILSSYFQKIQNICNKSLAKDIKIASSNILLINQDNELLNQVFTIQVPNQNIIEEYIKKILNITTSSSKKEIKSLIDLSIFDFYIKLKPYVHYYLTILELSLENIYKSWITRFLDSKIYKTSIYNNIRIERALRWIQTLTTI